MGLLEDLFGSTPPSSPTFTHAELGEFGRRDNGWWETTITSSGAAVRLAIIGDEAGPERKAMESAAASVAKLERLRDEAVELVIQDLSREDASIDPGAFALLRLCYPRADKPDEFWLELCMQGDDDGIWRVEFGPVPVHASLDVVRR